MSQQRRSKPLCRRTSKAESQRRWHRAPPTRTRLLNPCPSPGECAQVDWGHYASVSAGNTRRKLSFFVMVLCYSRLMYLEFTVLDVGLVDAPAPRPWPAPLPVQAPLHFRGEMLNPAIDRRVVDCDAAFGHHRFEIPVADWVPAVPAHGPEHDLTAEVASLEITHAATPRSSQRRQFTDSGRFLQQSLRN